ncbi:amidohydrolase family protein [[Mycobacterium] vasticus]|uniref:Amidohydrolase family protein n=1 Tax=[Mycobacterium] vasticus TaxID=2875777 RepID=A0ABU5Z0X2_9MYCO|nr:amidohydrolase family protein [Mycolicibacter sp. MYC017]MEB3070274.1 amidohydrolase family protein [Mycolicibacter sp. MYC017]
MTSEHEFDLISVDDHIIEPAHLWVDRLPAKYREIGPHVEVEGDREYWVYEGRRGETMGLNAVAGKERTEYSQEPARFSDMIPGCYDPKERVKDMDRDGVRGSLSFPSYPQFCGQKFMKGKDKVLSDLCVKAWNDFILDEWCAAGPDRFIPMIIGQLWDPEMFAEEVRRCAAKGAKAISFSENPHLLRLPSLHSDHWDPVWRAAVETDMPICMHIGSSSTEQHTAPDAPWSIAAALQPLNAHMAATDIMWSPITHKFPAIKFVMSEGGIGWLPFALERADWIWEKHGHWDNLSDTPPSEIFKRNIWGCFTGDRSGVEARYAIGVDKIMWESDYPHVDSSWPNSQEHVRKNMEGVPKDEVDLMTHGNAERVFNFPG